MRGKMDCHGLTDVGRSRNLNEDQFLIADLNKSMLVHQTSLKQDDHTRLFGGSQGQLLLVADGMGGHAAGEQASAIAVESLEQYVLNTMSWFFRLQENIESDLVDEFKAALDVCQKSIETAALINPARQGMGTTLPWPTFCGLGSTSSTWATAGATCFVTRGWNGSPPTTRWRSSCSSAAPLAPMTLSIRAGATCSTTAWGEVHTN